MKCLTYIFIATFVVCHQETVFHEAGVPPKGIKINTKSDEVELIGKNYALNAMNKYFEYRTTDYLTYKKNLDKLDIIPKSIEFNNKHIYSFEKVRVIVQNNFDSQHIIFLHSALLESTNFYLENFYKHYLQPETSVAVHVSYNPQKIGEHNTELRINANSSLFIVPIKAFCSVNYFELYPIILEYNGGSAKTDYYVYNPHNYGLFLYDVYTHDAFLKVKTSSEIGKI